jgi:hypothetical protein
MRTDQTADILQRRGVGLAEVANSGLIDQQGGESRNPADVRCNFVGLWYRGTVLEELADVSVESTRRHGSAL